PASLYAASPAEARTEEGGQALTMEGGVAEGDLVELGALQVQVQVVLPREADAAVDLEARRHDPAGGVRAPHLGRRRRDRGLGIAGGEAPGRVVHGGAHALDVDEHVG